MGLPCFVRRFVCCFVWCFCQVVRLWFSTFFLIRLLLFASPTIHSIKAIDTPFVELKSMSWIISRVKSRSRIGAAKEGEWPARASLSSDVGSCSSQITVCPIAQSETYLVTK